MQQDLIIGILAGLGGMLGWGFADFFAKKTIDEIGDIVTLVWAHIFGTLIFALVALFQVFSAREQSPMPHSLREWGLLLFFGVLQGAVYLMVYKGFGKGQLAVLNPVFSSYSGLAAIVSILVLGEVISANKLLALLIVFTGILLLSIDTKALRMRRLAHVPGFREVAIAAVLATFWTVSWNQFLQGKGWLSYAVFMYAFMTVAVTVLAKVQRISLSPVKSNSWKFLMLIGLGETVAYLSISYGFSVTSLVSVIALLSGAFSLPTIILSRIFLRERISTIQTIGGLATITGVAILSVLVNI